MVIWHRDFHKKSAKSPSKPLLNINLHAITVFSVMKKLFFLLSVLVTGVWVFILNSSLVLPAPLGRLLSPQHGIWQNAEPADADFSDRLALPGLKGKVDIFFDERLVPHVFADEEQDAWFAQGYLHAKFRLWQMELQVLSAAGRASEVAGEVALEHDREFRRLGMVFAAENSLKEIEANDTTRIQCDSYTAGVNAYIASLSESALPLEYKLLGYRPEPWTNLKSALLLKYMSFDLSGHETDIEMTNARNYFSPSDFDLLFPYGTDSIDPVVPGMDYFPRDSSGKLLPPGVSVQVPAHADSVYFKRPSVKVEPITIPDKDNGSNNWVVGPSRTKSGAPILCNDPHLLLNLPSLWFEMQISTPSFEVYGVSFPGAPGIEIGFNRHCAFGFTNAGRDVRDYYEIEFGDSSMSEYKFNNIWLKTAFRYEEIRVKNKPAFYDTVAYTVWGPVMYDHRFGGKRTDNSGYYAVRWKAHDPGNELLFFNRLNRMQDYGAFRRALPELRTPGQNCAFAASNGDIALVAQGSFPAKWKGQGDFIMPGHDTHYIWRDMIPAAEIPFQFNPERGFVSSANQLPADTSYPYYLGRNYPLARAIRLNRKLNEMNGVTVNDMMALQTDVYNVFAEWAMPLIKKYLNPERLQENEMKYYQKLQSWDFRYTAESEAATVFEVFWADLMDVVYDDEFENAPEPVAKPSPITLLDAIKRDSAYKFIDNRITITVETLEDAMLMAFREASRELAEAEGRSRLSWSDYRHTHIDHLLRLPAFSRSDISAGGSASTISAMKERNGPGWRMVVEMKKVPEGYGIYAGGQSGNPGSRYYDNFINSWKEGKYYRLQMLSREQAAAAKVIGKLNLHP